MDRSWAVEGKDQTSQAKHEDFVDPLAKVDNPAKAVDKVTSGTATPTEEQDQDVVNQKKFINFWGRKPSAVEAQEDLRHFTASHRVSTFYRFSS